MRNMKKKGIPMKARILSWLALPMLLLLSGCPESGVVTVVGNLAPAGTVVYLADQDDDGVFELYLASSGAKLNGPLTAGGNVTSFTLTPDKSSVVYRADQTTDEVFELYRVNVATPGVSQKLNGTLIPPGGDVMSFSITPDGSSVIYLADQQTDQVFQVYRVLFSTPQSSTLLNPALASGRTVTQFAVTPDSAGVVYIADETTNNVDELYQVAFSNPLVSMKLNSTLTSGGNVIDFVITPNSGFVVYLADQTTDGVFQLYRAQASVAGSGSVTPLNGTLVTGGNVTRFAVTPNSAAVIYRADEDVDNIFNLYRVEFSNPQASVQLNGALTAGGNVSTSFAIAPNGLVAVYRADQRILGVEELYSVALTSTPGAAQQLNPNYVGGQDVTDFAITPDSSAVIYMANETSSAVQLYRVLFSAPQPSSNSPLNGSLVAGGNVASFAIASNSTNVLYRADQSTFGVEELYLANVTSPGTSSKLNGQLVVPGGNVVDFTF